MSVISKLKEAIIKKDWQLVDQALQDLSGIAVIENKKEKTIQEKKEVVVQTIKNDDDQLNKFMINTNNTTAKAKESIIRPVFENKFVDDQTLECSFIEQPSKDLQPKKYRRPVDESSGFQSVNCTKCSSLMEITSEEYAFKSRDSESSGFICVPCMKKAVRR
ncbi:hypothetical protein EBU24_00120 [bacterium]|nr:hypothetical protein [bacterium]